MIQIVQNNTPSADILVFPKSKIVRFVPEESKKELKETNLKKNIDNFVHVLAQDLLIGFREMSPGSGDFDREDFKKDFSYGMEVIRASLYRANEVVHPLHEIIDSSIEMGDTTETEVVDDESDNLNDIDRP